MKTFWKILPLTLPILVLISVLSACGKGDRINWSLKPAAKDTTKKEFGVRANGSAGTRELNPADFRDQCAAKNGRIVHDGTACIAPALTVAHNSATLGNQAIGAVKQGDLLVASGPSTHDAVEILRNRVHLMYVGDKLVMEQDGDISFYTSAAGPSGTTATVWNCFDSHVNMDLAVNPTGSIDRVTCGIDMLPSP